MFRTSCVHHQGDYVVHAVFYGVFFMYLYKQSKRCKDFDDLFTVHLSIILVINQLNAQNLVL